MGFMVAGSSAAPGSLETVRGFVNTRDVESSVEALSTAGALQGWLQEASLLDVGAEARPVDLQRARALREALRSAMAANHSATSLPAEALAVFNDVAQRADLSLRITADLRWAMRPRAGGIDRALGSLLVLVTDAIADGTWRRLKVCLNTTCQWAFYDQSRARSGKWCSMQVCGNRAKQQAWRARNEKADGGPMQV